MTSGGRKLRRNETASQSDRSGARRSVVRPRLKVFTTRRWSADLGDPGRPRSVAGVAVSRVLCRRQDGAAALVVLTDGRLALTGPVLAAGAADDVAAYLRQRAGHAVTAREVGWLALCSHTLAAERETNRPHLGLAR